MMSADFLDYVIRRGAPWDIKHESGKMQKQDRPMLIFQCDGCGATFKGRCPFCSGELMLRKKSSLTGKYVSKAESLHVVTVYGCKDCGRIVGHHSCPKCRQGKLILKLKEQRG